MLLRDAVAQHCGCVALLASELGGGEAHPHVCGDAVLREAAAFVIRHREAELPQRLFSVAPYYQGVGWNWDISTDGQRFLMIRQAGEPVMDELILVQHWYEELKRLVPVD